MTKKRKAFINICEEDYGVQIPRVYLDHYRDLYENHNVMSYTFYIGTRKTRVSYKFHTSVCCIDEEDIIYKIQKLSLEKFDVFINTFTEQLIDFSNKVKEKLGQKVSIHKDSFRNKALQRKLLQDFNPDLGIKFLSYEPSKIDTQKIIKYLGFPFVIKPISGMESSGVGVINSINDLDDYLNNYDIFLKKLNKRGLYNSVLIFEEYIDGDMYSVDYYVDSYGLASYTPPVKVRVGADIGINDFMNISSSYRNMPVSPFLEKDLKNFMSNTIQALGIKNTYIHHEFKLNSKNQLKTIEVNGRIGGHRLELIKQGLDINWLSGITNCLHDNVLKYNFSSFLVYPVKKGYLLGFNEGVLEKIRALPSFHLIREFDGLIGSEIGLTKDGYSKVLVIQIKNANLKQFERDYNFIEENYTKLLILE